MRDKDQVTLLCIYTFLPYRDLYLWDHKVHDIYSEPMEDGGMGYIGTFTIFPFVPVVATVYVSCSMNSCVLQPRFQLFSAVTPVTLSFLRVLPSWASDPTSISREDTLRWMYWVPFNYILLSYSVENPMHMQALLHSEKQTPRYIEFLENWSKLIEQELLYETLAKSLLQ